MHPFGNFDASTRSGIGILRIGRYAGSVPPFLIATDKPIDWLEPITNGPGLELETATERSKVQTLSAPHSAERNNLFVHSLLKHKFGI